MIFFSIWLLSVLRGHSVFSSPPQRPITSDYKGFLCQILSSTLFSDLNSWERASIFPFECSVLNKGTTGTIFITSLVWRGEWGLNAGPPALESSTLPLGYRGGSALDSDMIGWWIVSQYAALDLRMDTIIYFRKKTLLFSLACYFFVFFQPN